MQPLRSRSPHGVTGDAAEQGHDLGPARLGALQPRHPLAQRGIEIAAPAPSGTAPACRRTRRTGCRGRGRSPAPARRAWRRRSPWRGTRSSAWPSTSLLVELARSRHIRLISFLRRDGVPYRMFKNSPIAGLAFWLVERSRRADGLPELFQGFCAPARRGRPRSLARAARAGDPAPRTQRHHAAAGRTGRWRRSSTQRAGILTSDSYLRSPTRIVDETEPAVPLAQRRAARSTCRGWRRYAADGVTDYLMLPLPFLDTTRTAVHRLCDQGPGRLHGRRLALLDAASRMFSPWAERALLRKIAVGLLERLSRPGRPVGASMTARSSAATCAPSGPRSGSATCAASPPCPTGCPGRS